MLSRCSASAKRTTCNKSRVRGGDWLKLEGHVGCGGVRWEVRIGEMGSSLTCVYVYACVYIGEENLSPRV